MVRPLGLMILFGGLLATLAFFLGALGLRLRRARLTITTVKRSHVQSFGNAVAALVSLASMGFQVVTRKNRLCFLLCRAICPLPASTTLKRSESQSFGKCRQPRRGLAITFFPSSLTKRLCDLLCNAISPLPASTTLNFSHCQPRGKAFTFLLQQVSRACLLFIRRKRLWTLQCNATVLPGTSCEPASCEALLAAEALCQPDVCKLELPWTSSSALSSSSSSSSSSLSSSVSSDACKVVLPWALSSSSLASSSLSTSSSSLSSSLPPPTCRKATSSSSPPAADSLLSAAASSLARSTSILERSSWTAARALGVIMRSSFSSAALSSKSIVRPSVVSQIRAAPDVRLPWSCVKAAAAAGAPAPVPLHFVSTIMNWNTAMSALRILISRLFGKYTFM